MIGKYKLWGRIEQTLAKGTYSLVVKDNYRIGNMVLTKGIDLVKPSPLGGKLFFYPIAFCIMGIICIIFGIYLKYDMGDYDQLMATYNKD